MISEEKLQSKLEDCNNAYDKFEAAVTDLIEGQNIKPSRLSALRGDLKYKLNMLDETIKQYCR